MPDLKSQITEEIVSVRNAMEDAKNLIKKNAGKGLDVSEAEEQSLRELRTRLSVLESNLEKAEGAAA